MPRLLPIVGCKNAGKTRTCEVLIPELLKLGVRVGTLKYTEHDGFDWDQPGKDTHRHRDAGSMITGIFGTRICAFSLNHSEIESEPVESIVRVFYRTLDLVLLEGHRISPGPKIEVWRPGYTDRPVAHPGELLASYGEEIFKYTQPHFEYGRESALAQYIFEHVERIHEVKM